MSLGTQLLIDETVYTCVFSHLPQYNPWQKVYSEKEHSSWILFDSKMLLFSEK